MGGRCGCGDGGGWMSGSYGWGGKYYDNCWWWYWTVGAIVIVDLGPIGLSNDKCRTTCEAAMVKESEIKTSVQFLSKMHYIKKYMII